MTQNGEKGIAYRRRAQYHETDRMGVIHHANYVKWMEEARIEWMDEAGMPYRAVEAAGIVSPVAELSVRYRRPVGFDDVVEIAIRVERYSGVVLELVYTMTNLTRGELSATASSKHCFLKDGRPVALSKVLPAADEAIRRQMPGEESV